MAIFLGCSESAVKVVNCCQPGWGVCESLGSLRVRSQQVHKVVEVVHCARQLAEE